MYPKYSELEIPLLEEILKRGESIKPLDRGAQGRTVYDALADTFNLSPEARDEVVYENGKARPKWENIVRWARKELKAQGNLRHPIGLFGRLLKKAKRL